MSKYVSSKVEIEDNCYQYTHLPFGQVSKVRLGSKTPVLVELIKALLLQEPILTYPIAKNYTSFLIALQQRKHCDHSDHKPLSYAFKKSEAHPNQARWIIEASLFISLRGLRIISLTHCRGLNQLGYLLPSSKEIRDIITFPNCFTCDRDKSCRSS